MPDVNLWSSPEQLYKGEEPSVDAPEVQDAPSIRRNEFQESRFAFAPVRDCIGPLQVTERMRRDRKPDLWLSIFRRSCSTR